MLSTAWAKPTVSTAVVGRWSSVVGQITIMHATDNRLSPRRLRNAWDLAAQGQAAETQAADAKLAQIGARTSADFAAVVLARRELRLSCVFNSFCCRCQKSAPSFQLKNQNLQLSDHPMTRSPDHPLYHALNGIPKCFNSARA
jgi:hypothetical protein